VIAKITTHGSGDSNERLTGSYLPGVLEGFRENVRQLLASEDFRRVVSTPGAGQAGTPVAAGPGLAPITLLGPRIHAPMAEAARSVAIVYAADGQGSGFLVSSDGYVITNQHVVGGSKYVKLKWPGGAETLGEVVRADRRRDVALIKTEAQGRAPLALRLSPVQQGEAVFAIGTPLDDKLQNTMTKGIVSASRTMEGETFVQSDVAVDHGNSGGPLLDEQGNVLAITDWGYAPDGVSHNLNFFIPIDEALTALGLTPARAAPAATAALAHPRRR
jgi:serine protease Do